MTAERDIVLVSVPFVLGVIFGHFICSASPLLPSYFTITQIISLILFILLSLSLIKSTEILIFSALFILGSFCVLTDIITDTIAVEKVNRFMSTMAHSRAYIAELIRTIPFETKSTEGLVLALTTGIRSDLLPEVASSFRNSGASHILALSGFHLGIIYMILNKIFTILGRSQRIIFIRSVSTISLCAAFTFATGCSPSIVRALLFIIISETCRLTHRKVLTLRVFCTAITIQLIADPSQIKEVGFQLSYLAMLGIYTIYPLIRNWIPSDGKLNPVKKIWNSLTLSISCQITTAPAAYCYFKTFPQYFLLSNLIALPLASALMAASLCTIILSAIGICPDWIVCMNDKICSNLIWSLQIISTM